MNANRIVDVHLCGMSNFCTFAMPSKSSNSWSLNVLIHLKMVKYSFEPDWYKQKNWKRNKKNIFSIARTFHFQQAKHFWKRIIPCAYYLCEIFFTAQWCMQNKLSEARRCPFCVQLCEAEHFFANVGKKKSNLHHRLMQLRGNHLMVDHALQPPWSGQQVMLNA